MEGIAARLAMEYPASNDRFGVALQPIRDAFVTDIRPAILVLFGAVMFVLLIACANVANLFLVRGASRTKEVALRIALGASRGRIISQMMTESFVLAVLGGVLGPGAGRCRNPRNVAADSSGHVVRRYGQSKQRCPAVCGGRCDVGGFHFRLDTRHCIRPSLMCNRN